MHLRRKGCQRHVFLILLVQDPADLLHPSAVTVRPLVFGLRFIHPEFLIHDIHDLIDDGPVPQFIAQLLLGVVFDKSGDQPPHLMKCLAVPVNGAVADEIWVLRTG